MSRAPTRIDTLLARAGVDADLHDAEDAPGPEGYDIAVVGGAVYAARWVENVREWTRAHSDALKAMPCWIFSMACLRRPTGSRTKTYPV